jgi:hypothetical protein
MHPWSILSRPRPSRRRRQDAQTCYLARRHQPQEKAILFLFSTVSGSSAMLLPPYPFRLAAPEPRFVTQ